MEGFFEEEEKCQEAIIKGNIIFFNKLTQTNETKIINLTKKNIELSVQKFYAYLIEKKFMPSTAMKYQNNIKKNTKRYGI